MFTVKRLKIAIQINKNSDSDVFFQLQEVDCTKRIIIMKNIICIIEHDLLFKIIIIMFKQVLFTCLILGIFCLFPPPQKEVFTYSHPFAQKCPMLECGVSEVAGWEYYYNKIMSRLECPSREDNLKTQPLNLEVLKVSSLPKQAYNITVSEKSIKIEVHSYQGYVYAMQTLYQMLSKQKLRLGYVYDEPIVSYRGIMIDSVRHFLPLRSIERLIESMPLSKLNILHWHLADDQAFTLQLITHPELAQSGAYSSKEFYTVEEVKALLELAKKNGVSIVPEFDTPGHVRSWGLSQKWAKENITILCPKGEGYNHQLDLSKSETYKLVEEVWSEVDDLFKDSPYLHLGGDEVFGSCWDRRPAIQTFMKLRNISGYGQLQMYWRSQLKQVLPSSRKLIFWRNNAENLTTGENDILQYWGAQNDTATVVKNSTSKIILSPSDYIYLNTGKTNIWQNGSLGAFSTWKHIYQSFLLFPEGVDKERILGAEACLWGETSNENTLDNNLWVRATALGAKLWSETVLETYQLVEDMVAVQMELVKMGGSPSPFVSEFCERSPKICFPPKMKILSE